MLQRMARVIISITLVFGAVMVLGTTAHSATKAPRKIISTQVDTPATRSDARRATLLNPFDTLYPASFKLQPLSTNAIPAIAKLSVKASSLDTPSYLDPVYGTRIYKATAATDFLGATFVRHDYSRRQAFNADNSRFIALSSNGFWLLYDANTFQVLARAGYNGALKGAAGDCEMIWHPSDPRKLWYTSTNGGLVWYEKDVETDTDTVLVDFTGRLPWPQAKSVWTKAEGTSSADGRYWAFMATTYDSVKQTNTIYGLFTWDRQLNKIIGAYAATNFAGDFPDHISISPSGKYAVSSWDYPSPLGTRAYPLDFSSSIQLYRMSTHSDLAIGPNGEDYYVFADYDTGMIRALNLATSAAFDVMPLYPQPGESYAVHISGKAFDKPGWVVISTYADYANYGSIKPAPTLRPMYRKIMLVELKPGGRQYNIAHTRAGANYGGYWGEHQATISRDGSRILFASNFDDGGDPSDYMIGLPSWVYATPTVPPTSTATATKTPAPPTATATKTPMPPTATPTKTPVPPSPTPTPTITPVSGCLIGLNNGALYTNQRTVTVQSNLPGAAQIQVSNDGRFANAVWQAYQPALTWALPDIGQRIATLIVHARFRDANNNLLCNGQIAIDEIIFDVQAPKVLAATRAAGQLQLQAEDQLGGSGVTDMQVSTQSDFADASWQPWQATVAVENEAGTTVYVRVRDGAGNESDTVSTQLTTQPTLYLPLIVH